MRIEKQAFLAASPAEIWALVHDLEQLGRCVPGVQSVRVTGRDAFEAEVRQRVGPIALVLQLRVRIVELDPPISATVEVEGVDRATAGRVRQRQHIVLEPRNGRTSVKILADLQLAGRLATFGQRVIAAKADEFADELLANIERLVKSNRPDSIPARARSEESVAKAGEGPAP